MQKIEVFIPGAEGQRAVSESFQTLSICLKPQSSQAVSWSLESQELLWYFFFS